MLYLGSSAITSRTGSAVDRISSSNLLCGVVAAIGQGLVQPEPMVGASGAIAGVLGAYLVLYPTARVSTLIFLGLFISVVQLPALIVIGFFIVLQMIDAVAELRFTAHQATSNIAYFAHIFGFAAGILLLLLFRQRREPVDSFRLAVNRPHDG